MLCKITGNSHKPCLMNEEVDGEERFIAQRLKEEIGLMG
jgi:hypothetical protein